MKNLQNIVEENLQDYGELSAEEQLWFPNILRYIQANGFGDGKRGRLHRAYPVVIENFLSTADLTALFTYTLEHEAHFTPSQLYERKDVAPSNKNILDRNVLRSLRMYDIDTYYKNMIDRRVDSVLPDVLHHLGVDPFPIKKREHQLAASNDSEFFKIHTDKGPATSHLHSRLLSYVYYFCREPKSFTGGNLQVYDTITVDDFSMATLNFQTIIPQRNQIVFFPSYWLHEVLPVHCPSQQFADSRFTFNGWLH